MSLLLLPEGVVGEGGEDGNDQNGMGRWQVKKVYELTDTSRDLSIHYAVVVIT